MAGEKAPAPSMAAQKAPASSGVSNDSKLFGALAYFLSIITGIVVFVMKKDDSYAKFHAMQSILVGIVVIVLSIVVFIVQIILAIIPILGWILSILIGLVFYLGAFLLWLFLMWKAYSGEKFKLPIIGDQAEKMSA